jgi:outer membrane protein TolC
MRNTSLLLFILFLIGCAAIPYEESKVEIISVNQQIIQLDIFDSQFEKFLKSQGYSTLDLPLKQWSLQELLLAQLFFNYEIKNAKASLAWVKSDESIALLYPPSSIGIEIGRGDSNQEISQNIFGGGFNFTFESASKRLIRHEIAFNKSQAASLQYEIKIWDARSKLMDLVVDFLERQDLIKITKEELRLKHSILQMIKKRVDAGILSQVEHDRTSLELSTINQILLNLQYEQESVKSKIATSVGLSLEKFNLIPIDTTKIKGVFNRFSNDFINANGLRDIQYKATTNSKILRLLLANYAIAESSLKYEIAKQYPDFNFIDQVVNGYFFHWFSLMRLAIVAKH